MDAQPPIVAEQTRSSGPIQILADPPAASGIIEVGFEPTINNQAPLKLEPVLNSIEGKPEGQKSATNSESLGSEESDHLDTLNFSFEPVKVSEVSGAAEATTRSPSEERTDTGMDMVFKEKIRDCPTRFEWL